MSQTFIFSGELIDDRLLGVEGLAQACAVDVEWIQARVKDGLLSCTITRVESPLSRSPVEYALKNSLEWRFASADLVRARRLVDIERTFDANPELAAFVADLLEEISTLKRQRKVP